MYIVQAILSVASIYVGYRKGIPQVFVYIVGAYLGMGLGGFEWEGIESSGWLILALFMLTLPFYLPLTAGVIAGAVKGYRSRNTSGDE